MSALAADIPHSNNFRLTPYTPFSLPPLPPPMFQIPSALRVQYPPYQDRYLRHNHSLCVCTSDTLTHYVCVPQTHSLTMCVCARAHARACMGVRVVNRSIHAHSLFPPSLLLPPFLHPSVPGHARDLRMCVSPSQAALHWCRHTPLAPLHT
jgi:hypothetical protein